MPIFRTTAQILKSLGEEVREEDWSNYDTIQLPATKKWDYQRNMQIEDVEIWEVIQEGGNGMGIYASWMPLAEFYMVMINWDMAFFYGKGAQDAMLSFVKEKSNGKINLPMYKALVTDEEYKYFIESEVTTNI